MAKYLILIYGDEARWEAMSSKEWQQTDAGHGAFRALAGEAILSSGQLEPMAKTRSLRRSAKGVLATDGPFVESKEVLGGFYVVEVADLAAAEQLAGFLAEVRQHDHSGVQIHPLVDHG